MKKFIKKVIKYYFLFALTMYLSGGALQLFGFLPKETESPTNDITKIENVNPSNENINDDSEKLDKTNESITKVENISSSSSHKHSSRKRQSHVYHYGPRGGKYYYNSKGKKVYVKK